MVDITLSYLTFPIGLSRIIRQSQPPIGQGVRRHPTVAGPQIADTPSRINWWDTAGLCLPRYRAYWGEVFHGNAAGSTMRPRLITQTPSPT